MKNRSLVPVILVAALAPALLSVTARAHSAHRDAIRVTERHIDASELVAPASIAPALPLEGLVPPSEPFGPPKPPTLSESLAEDPPPLETSPKPTNAEWQKASALPVSATSRCTSHRVREWLRVRCEYFNSQQIALLSGRREGTYLAVQKKSADWFGDTRESVVISMHPGDRRVITMTGVEMGRYMGNGPSTDAMLSEQWVEGEASPLVVVSE